MLKPLLFNILFLGLVPVILVQAVTQLKLPVVLPPFEVDGGVTLDAVKPEWGSCLFYMENLGIAIYYDTDTYKDKKPFAWPAVIQSVNTKHTFGWDDSYVNCIAKFVDVDPEKFTNQTFTFVIDVTVAEDVKSEYDQKTLFTIKAGTNFKFTLKFMTLVNFGWQLTEISTEAFTIPSSGDWVNGDLKVEKGNAVVGTANATNIGGYYNYTYGCVNTTSTYFNTSQDKVYVGIFFGNLQIQYAGYQISDDNKQIHFSTNTNDCVPTFSHPSLMGIIITIIFATSLVFAFVMLNSVKTLDRLDDPRQKQIFVNAKD